MRFLLITMLPATVLGLFFNLGGGGGGCGCCPQPACTPAASCGGCGGSSYSGASYGGSSYGPSYGAPASYAAPAYAAAPASYVGPAPAPSSYVQQPVGRYASSPVGYVQSYQAPVGGYQPAPVASYQSSSYQAPAPVAPSIQAPSGYSAPQAGYNAGKPLYTPNEPPQYTPVGSQVLPASLPQEQPYSAVAAAASGGRLEEVADEDESNTASKQNTTLSIAPEPTAAIDIAQLTLTNDTECNNDDLRQIVKENMSDDLNSSKRLIQLGAEAKFGGRFDVICSASDFSYVTNTELFCQETQDKVSCYAYRQL